MSLYMLVLLAVAGLFLCLGLVLYALPLVPSVRKYIEKVSACGYLGDPPSKGWVRFLYWSCWVLKTIQTGRVKVINPENLEFDGPVLYASNHVSWVDPAIVDVALDRPVRFLAAQRFFRAWRGLFSLLAGPAGAISVDLRQGRGRPAAESAVKALAAGETIFIFPEAYTYMDGVMGPFRKGLTHIAKDAAAKRGSPVCIVPIFLRYGRTPGSWIRKWDEPNQYLWQLANFWYYRRGCTMVVGEPICSSLFPQDVTEATDMLAQKIADLDPLKLAKPMPSGVNLPLPADDQDISLPKW